MLDRLYLPALALAAAAVIALAIVFPQGLGDRSPAPFGYSPIQRSPQMQAAMMRETLAAQRRGNQQKAAAHELQSQALAPNQ